MYICMYVCSMYACMSLCPRTPQSPECCIAKLGMGTQWVTEWVHSESLSGYTVGD